MAETIGEYCTCATRRPVFLCRGETDATVGAKVCGEKG